MCPPDDPMTTVEQLAALPGVLDVLLVRSDGLLIARNGAQAAFADDDPGAAARVAAMTATALSLNKRLLGAFYGGVLSETRVIGTEAQLFLYAAGPRAVLTLVTTKDAEAERLSGRVREALDNLKLA